MPPPFYSLSYLSMRTGASSCGDAIYYACDWETDDYTIYMLTTIRIHELWVKGPSSVWIRAAGAYVGGRNVGWLRHGGDGNVTGTG
jgi:hypothetical protein